MRRVFPVLIAVLMALTSLQAEAKRMGGGKSIGRQSSNVTQQSQTTSPQSPGFTQNSAGAQQSAQQANRPGMPAQTPAAPQRKPWAGILGGLAAGLGLAWLANSLGFGGGFANMMLILLVVVAALFLWRMLRSRNAGAVQPQPTPVYQGAAAEPRSYSPKNVGNDASARPWESQQTAFQPAAAAAAAGGSMIGSGLSGSQNWGIPAGFDAEGFISSAKRNFMTLQDAWDRGDVSSLRSMMTDDMLAEIRSQLAEREAQRGAANKTEVENLQAQLLGIEETGNDYLASVEFSGMMREEVSAGFNPFREVWNMSKSKTGGSGWLVAGVQSMQ